MRLWQRPAALSCLALIFGGGLTRPMLTTPCWRRACLPAPLLQAAGVAPQPGLPRWRRRRVRAAVSGDPGATCSTAAAGERLLPLVPWRPPPHAPDVRHPLLPPPCALAAAASVPCWHVYRAPTFSAGMRRGSGGPGTRPMLCQRRTAIGCSGTCRRRSHTRRRSHMLRRHWYREDS